MTEIADVVEQTYARRHGARPEPRDERTPEQIAAEDRALEEQRRAANLPSAVAERKAYNESFSHVHGALKSAMTTYLRHGEQLNGQDREDLARLLERDLGGDFDPASKAAIREWVRVAADANADGDKQTGFVRAEELAHKFADRAAGWKRPSKWAQALNEPERSTAEIADSIDGKRR